jgi:hypothetical protein
MKTSLIADGLDPLCKPRSGVEPGEHVRDQSVIVWLALVQTKPGDVPGSNKQAAVGLGQDRPALRSRRPVLVKSGQFGLDVVISHSIVEGDGAGRVRPVLETARTRF